MSFFEFPHTRTYDSDLGWLIKNAKTTDDIIKNIEAWIAETQPTIDDLKKLYSDIEAGNFPPSMEEGFKKWIQNNAINLIGELVKSVFFGITDSGYFVAYIPDSWCDIIFGTTGLDDFPAGIDYGHLTLTY